MTDHNTTEGSQSPLPFVPSQGYLSDDSIDTGSAVEPKTDSTTDTEAAMQESAERVAKLEAALLQARRQHDACVLRHKAALAQKLADRPVVVPAVRPNGKPVCKYGVDCTQTMNPEHLKKFDHPPEVLAQIDEARAAAAANRKPCPFFLSPGGCRRGDKCRDKHDK